MPDYVLCYCEDTTNEKILIIHKDRPEWQKGRINLPGGKIEQGETVEEAAIRELREETGYECRWNHAIKVGEIDTGSGIVHVVKMYGLDCEVPLTKNESEVCEWVSWHELEFNPRLFPNLRLVIPLLNHNLYYWRITDIESSAGKIRHSMMIAVPTFYQGYDVDKI